MNKRLISLGLVAAFLYGLGTCDNVVSGEKVSLEQKVENVQSSQSAKPQEKAESQLLAYSRYTGNFEGRRGKVYDPNPYDNKKEPTIGVGHYLGRGDSREVFSRVLPEVNYDAILEGKVELTNEQVDRLFAEDLPKYVEKARKLFPEFDSYPKYLRQALVDGCYRGDLSGSPKTIKLINERKFSEAAREYINRRDYRNAQRTGKMRGIVKRMDSNKSAMERYAEDYETAVNPEK